jgi:hypothetical protein
MQLENNQLTLHKAGCTCQKLHEENEQIQQMNKN